MVYFLIAGEHSIHKITESIFATRGNSLLFANEYILLANTTNKQILVDSPAIQVASPSPVPNPIPSEYYNIYVSKSVSGPYT